MQISSYDENGPLISHGSVSFSEDSGFPLGLQSFELPVFFMAADESTVCVEYNGLHLSERSTHNDYYGFGTSPESALQDARKFIQQLDGANVEILVRSKISIRPCFPSDDTPFYSGSQRVCYLPRSWRCEDRDVVETELEYVTWKNGTPTEGAKHFFDKIAELVSRDAAPNRKGPLHSILTRKDPTTKSGFLIGILDPKDEGGQR